MAESIITTLQRRLKPGYTISYYASNTYGVQDLTGNWLRDGEFLISFKDSSVPVGHLYQNLIAALRRNGALHERTRTSEHRPKPKLTVNIKTPKNAVIVAQEILRDPDASPRERAVARNYLALMESHQNLRKLTQALGRRLKQIEKEID